MVKGKSGGNPRSIPGDKTQVNFNIQKDQLKKVKYIAFKNEVSKSEIYNSAVDEYIDKYEKKYGKIKPM